MKLKSLIEFIRFVNDQVDDYIIDKDCAYDEIINHTKILLTPLTLESVIGENCFFKGDFRESDCWDAGYDGWVGGDFIRYNKNDPYVISGKTISDLIHRYNDIELNDHGIKYFYGQRELNLLKLSI